jgi:hypothetical protein
MKNNQPIDKDFDGHLEKPLKDMTTKEKLDYIWSQIELKNYIKNNVVKKKKELRE